MLDIAGRCSVGADRGPLSVRKNSEGACNLEPLAHRQSYQASRAPPAPQLETLAASGAGVEDLEEGVEVGQGSGEHVGIVPFAGVLEQATIGEARTSYVRPFAPTKNYVWPASRARPIELPDRARRRRARPLARVPASAASLGPAGGIE